MSSAKLAQSTSLVAIIDGESALPYNRYAGSSCTAKKGGRRTKFLVIIEGVPGQPTMLPKQTPTLTKEAWAWSRRMLETKKADVTYGLADHAGGLMGGCGIMNVESVEELAENLASFPMAGIVTIKV